MNPAFKDGDCSGYTVWIDFVAEESFWLYDWPDGYSAVFGMEPGKATIEPIVAAMLGAAVYGERITMLSAVRVLCVGSDSYMKQTREKRHDMSSQHIRIAE